MCRALWRTRSVRLGEWNEFSRRRKRSGASRTLFFADQAIVLAAVSCPGRIGFVHVIGLHPIDR